MKKDITQLDDVKLLVDSFYTKIRNDELLANIFNEIIQDNWPKHLEKMYQFWQTVLLDEHTYYGAPFRPHAHLPVDKRHFERWLSLFEETLDEHFKGKIADEARWRANKMAQMFLFKIEHHRQNNTNPLV